MGATLFGRRLRKAMSFRVMMMATFPPILAVAPFIWLFEKLGWPAVGRAIGWLWVPMAALIWLGMVFNDDMAATCYACRKRVKLGAASCHHCGREQTLPVAVTGERAEEPAQIV